MAYRGEDAGDALEAPTADGTLKVSLGPNRLTLSLGPLSLNLAERTATLNEVTGKKQNKVKRTSYAITGIIYARGVPRDDIGLWVEVREDVEAERAAAIKAAAAAAKAAAATAKAAADNAKTQPRAKRVTKDPGKSPATATPPPPSVEPIFEPHPALRRIFGVPPVSLMDPTGLRALAKLDAVANRLRVAVADYATAANLWFARATEIGAGHPLDKVLLVDYGERHAIYARKLFRDRARHLASVYTGDSKVVVPDGKVTHEVLVTSRYSVTVRGDYVRFADRTGTDQARISVPWVGPEDREELARRIGQLVHRT